MDINDIIAKNLLIYRKSFEEVVRLFAGTKNIWNGVCIDLYGEYLLAQYYNEDFKFLDFESFVMEVAKIVSDSGIEVKGILAKNRSKINNPQKISEYRKSSLLHGEYPSEKYIVYHCGSKYEVDLLNSQHTGVFADMRNVRMMMTEFYNSGGRMLNLFSYTGAFSVHALKNGLSSSINVDLSKNILRRAQKNYELNSLSVDQRDFLNMEAKKAIKYFSSKNIKFDFIVFDPPTFSRNKKGTFSIEKNYREFLKDIAVLMNGDSYLLSAINSNKISKKQFENYHAGVFNQIFFQNEAEDFRSEGVPYLKTGLWKLL